MRKLLVIITTFGLLLVLPSTAIALNIEYTTTGATQVQINAFEQAVQRWETQFTDPVTVDIDFSFSSMGPGVIGGTIPSLWYADFLSQQSFSGVMNQLTLDQTSLADATAVSYLNDLPTSGANLLWYSNGNLYGSDVVVGTSANLKALGYSDLPGDDGTMEFNTDFTFDYDPSDGISAGMMDFVGVAAHEIGHVLGFVSIVDTNALEKYTKYPPSILDLYRHTDAHGSGWIDISFDGSDAYFSSDDGLTTIDLSDGANGSDGQQASHWADNLDLGIMDPTVGYGELLNMTGNDLLAFDVIGWNVIPEPATIILFGVALLGGTVMKRRRSWFV